MPAELHIVVPGLCGPFPENVVLPDNPALKSLATILSDADVQASADNYYDQLCECFEIEKPLPAAALRMLSDSAEYRTKYCLQCAPVFLQADMDHAILYDESSLELDIHEKHAFLNEINRHLEPDGIALQSNHSDEWFIVVDETIDLTTTPLHEVVGRNVNFHLPTGKDAIYWKRILNEIQMLLHMSTVNEQREASGKLAANSIWFWGQGVLDSSNMTSQYDHVCGDDSLLSGLAEYMQIEYSDISDCIAKDFDTVTQGSRVLLCDTRLMSAVSYADHERWIGGLHGVIEALLLPLIEQARQAKATIKIYPCSGSEFELKSASWLDAIVRPFIRRHELSEFICRDT